jgi:DNA-binding NtrC family response regulator
MRGVAAVVERVADCDATVLVTGESGVGKEVIARELHRRSSRASRPFIKVNCAALPADLLESEMFGHERGAFTGADTATMGKFEAASHGTIMLDEIAEMPAKLQAKLLHVLEDGQFSKLGSNKPIQPDVRVVAATNRSLVPMIADGSFREDLYYRLQVIEIHVPPLRERREEILPLAESFLVDFAHKAGTPPPELSLELRESLAHYDWPGNIRELENVMQRFLILRDEKLLIHELCRSPRAQADAVASQPVEAAPQPISIATESTPMPLDSQSLPDLVRRTTDKVEREVIARALDVVRWNRRRAARMLGVSYKTLLNKMKALGLDAEAPSELVDAS